MTCRRAIQIAIAVVLITGAAAYAYDPPWIAGVTSGLGDWESDPDGVRFRWTTGHATFYVPRERAWIILPLRADAPGPRDETVVVDLTADDRFLGRVVLGDPVVWRDVLLPMPARLTRRRFRRIDLRVSGTAGRSHVGVQLGEARFDAPK